MYFRLLKYFTPKAPAMANKKKAETITAIKDCTIHRLALTVKIPKGAELELNEAGTHYGNILLPLTEEEKKFFK